MTISLSNSYNRIPSCDRDSVAIPMHYLHARRNRYNKLLEYVINNEVGELKSVDEDLLNYVDDLYGKPLLSLICEGKDIFTNVTIDTMKLLIEKGAKVDQFNPRWYGWEPLHYASVAADKDKLETICNALGKKRINTLTTLSENALHILLNHGPLEESFNISCQNGVNLKMSKIIRGEKACLVECANVLIKAGVDVNHSNFWNETPILLAIKRKYWKVVKLLLKVEGCDLDSCKTAVSKKTARELLRGKENIFGLLPKPAESRDPGKTLFQCLKSGDEEAFLKHNGGNIKEYVNIIDGDNEYNSSCTMLQYCFRRGFIACYQDIKTHQYEARFRYSDITANYLVQVFLRKGMVKCVQHLLDNGADINITMRKFNEPLLEMATMKGYYPFISLILERENTNLSKQIISNAALKAMNNCTNEIDLDSTVAVLLHRLVTPEQPIGNESTEILMEVLNLGLKKISKANIRLLLKCAGSLGTKVNGTNNTILEEIDPEVIQAHLDECVEQRNNNIYINYESFIRNNSTKEVEQIFLKSSTLNVYLNHLVFKILVNRKWEMLRICKNIKYFYLNLFFYMTFYCLLNAYVLLAFHGMFTAWTTVILILNILCWLILLFKEVVQVIASSKLYARDLNNYAEIFLIVSAFVVYITSEEIFMVLAILSSNLVLLLFLEQVPKLAKYIIILRTISFYLRYVLFYFIQFLAFALCFYILFSKPKASFWEELFNKIFETIIMFTGNLDYSKLEENVEKSKGMQLFSKAVFILFVLFMALILHNLLLGLLVTDMNDLNRSVKLFEQMKRASFVVKLETFFVSRIGSCFSKPHSLSLFDKDEKYLIVNETDRKMLYENERQHLDFILVKKMKKQNVLKKLCSYIKTKMNERSNENVPNEINKKLLEKLHLIEERMKIFHDITEVIKTELNKTKVN